MARTTDNRCLSNSSSYNRYLRTSLTRRFNGAERQIITHSYLSCTAYGQAERSSLSEIQVLLCRLHVQSDYCHTDTATVHITLCYVTVLYTANYKQ